MVDYLDELRDSIVQKNIMTWLTRHGLSLLLLFLAFISGFVLFWSYDDVKQRRLIKSGNVYSQLQHSNAIEKKRILQTLEATKNAQGYRLLSYMHLQKDHIIPSDLVIPTRIEDFWTNLHKNAHYLSHQRLYSFYKMDKTQLKTINPVLYAFIKAVGIRSPLLIPLILQWPQPYVACDKHLCDGNVDAFLNTSWFLSAKNPWKKVFQLVSVLDFIQYQKVLQSKISVTQQQEHDASRHNAVTIPVVSIDTKYIPNFLKGIKSTVHCFYEKPLLSSEDIDALLS